MPEQDTIERAFDLAKSGSYRQVDDIRLRLQAEGYSGVEDQLESALIKKWLVALMRPKPS